MGVMLKRLLDWLLTLIHTPRKEERAMPGYDREVLLAMLERHEGFRDRVYFDSEGILTVGIGHALGWKTVPEDVRDRLVAEGIMDRPFSREAMERQFYDDVAPAEREAQTLSELRSVDFNSLSPRRQMVLVNMCFNLGVDRLGNFVKMWAALAVGDYQTAADEMLDSRWARQVGVRAQELAAMMREG